MLGTEQQRSVVFVHPDLGIGGAEQLIVLAAWGLQRHKMYRVEIITAHHDKTHCFDETRSELKVTCHGDWLPRTLFGKAVALCSILFFYCHYPDKLLCTQRGGCVKQCYRQIIDSIEERTTAAADEVLVNSKFTESVVRQTFPLLRDRALRVMYPPVNWSTVSQKVLEVDDWERMVSQFPNELGSLIPLNYIVSLNRYEKKKNIQRAIHAVAWLKEQSPDLDTFPVLVIAGGYDPRVTENAEVYAELQKEVANLKSSIKVIFLRSIGDTLRWCLLRHALAVVYTPSYEHFGIVPVEAMSVGTPVIACRSGGPKESIEHELTGFLCSDEDEKQLHKEFGGALQKLSRRTAKERVCSRSKGWLCKATKGVIASTGSTTTTVQAENQRAV